MTSIGERLRSERERQGYSIEKIAAQLRISAHYLEAIENEDMEKLPGLFFYRSFVRQYADALRMDAAQVEHELESLKPPAVPAPTEISHFPIAVPPMPNAGADRELMRRVPGSLIALVLVIVGCAGVFSLWSKYRDNLQNLFASAPKQQERPVAVTPPAPAPAPAPQPETQPNPEPQQIAQAPAAEAPKPETPAAQPPAEPPARTLPPEVQGPRFKVNMTATEDAWVQISSSGKVLYIGILKAGESKAIEAATTARLIVGNAGGLNLQVNGQAVPPLGPRGQPRNVVLTPEGVRVPPPPPPQEQ